MKYGLAHDQSTHDEYLGQNQGNVILPQVRKRRQEYAAGRNNDNIDNRQWHFNTTSAWCKTNMLQFLLHHNSLNKILILRLFVRPEFQDHGQQKNQTMTRMSCILIAIE